MLSRLYNWEMPSNKAGSPLSALTQLSYILLFKCEEEICMLNKFVRVRRYYDKATLNLMGLYVPLFSSIRF